MTLTDVHFAFNSPARSRGRLARTISIVAVTLTALVTGVGPVATASADDSVGVGQNPVATGRGESPQTVQGAPPAAAVDPSPSSTASEWIVLCQSFSPCKSAGYGNADYDKVYTQSFWSQYGGHNCTNYVAYRMIRNGMSSTRPAGSHGYARDWGVGFASQTNDTPAVGSVAWWDSSFSSSGHVAYVERVISNDQIVISEDNWGGDFRWRTVSRNGGRWPQGFIHLKDVATTPAPSATFKPIATTRVLDTRFGVGAAAAPVAGGAEVSIAVSGRAGMPTTGVGAVVLNVTAVLPTATGYTTTYPSGVSRPIARNLTYTGGVSTSSMSVSKVGSDGRIRLYTSATSGLTADVLGWYPVGSAYTSITPKRVLDTRTGLGTTKARLPAGGRVDLLVAGGGTVPSSGVAAVVLGISTESPTSSGWLTAWPAGSARPVTTHVHVDPGRASTSVVTSRIGSGGKVSIDTGSSTELMVDVLGWFPTVSDQTSVTSARLLDTRTGTGGFTGLVGTGSAVRVPVLGRGGVPSSGVKAVSVTLTSLSSVSSGALSGYPTGWSRPGVGHVLYQGGRTVVNAAVLPVGADGSVSVYTSARSYVVVDVQGWIRS